MYGGGGKAKNSAANAPNLHSDSAWASPPREGRAAPAAALPALPARGTPSLRSRALSLLGLCSERCFQRAAARTRHLPRGFSRGLAAGAAGMRRAAGGSRAGLRGRRLLGRASPLHAGGRWRAAPCRRAPRPGSRRRPSPRLSLIHI